MNSIQDYIWKRRIHHGVRFQKGAVPFPESVEIGVEFNGRLEREEKLDLCLLTNAVMLELCQFARTVSKSESYFLFELVLHNFDLGVDPDNDVQCHHYARRVHSKVKQLKEQIRLKSLRWKEPFPFPDPRPTTSSAGSEPSEGYYPKRNKVVDSSVLTDGTKKSQLSESQKTESNGADSDVFIIQKRGGIKVKLTDDLYPYCKELGVTLFIQPEGTPKEKLDPTLVTNGVMMELLDFSRVLCGTYTRIVLDLVKQNFGYELNRLYFHVSVTRAMEGKAACVTAEEREAFLKKPFKVEFKKRNPKKRKSTDADSEELEALLMANDRRGTLRHGDSDGKEVWQDSDLSYMCPVDFETEMSDNESEGLSETGAETKSAASPDVKQEEEKVFISLPQPRTAGRDSRVSDSRLGRTAQKSPWTLFSEEKTEDMSVKTAKQKLWMRRAQRSKQILNSSKVNDMFARCRQIALDFNVGSGKKQKVDLKLFTNCVLWEVYKFATMMSKSLGSFLHEILDNNFKMVFQDELRQRNFLLYITAKEKLIQNHPARQDVEFLSSPFQFPEVYNVVDMTSDLQTVCDAEMELQTNCDSSASAASQQQEAEPHPFCKKLGLNLWSTEERPAGQKLDLAVITTGAVLEIVSFVRELCGSVREMVNDVVEHNFDLDLQSSTTTAAQVISGWYTTQRSMMKRQCPSPRLNRWLSMAVPLNGYSLPSPESATGSSPEDLDTKDFELDREGEAFNGNLQQLKRVDSYRICKEIGLDLDVGPKSEAKTKLDLQLLTRAALLELHQYVAQNCRRYVPALYEILEHNFDLSSQSHRRVEFAWSIASQVIAMAGKTCKTGRYLSQVFELPFEVSVSSQVVCKEEPGDGFSELDLSDNSGIVFVRELKPVDIEVVVD